MNRKENPDDPDSFAYLLRQIIGRDKAAVSMAAEFLGISHHQSLRHYVNGEYIPSRTYVEKWPKMLHEHYNLDRKCKITGLTLRQKLENKIAELPELSGKKTAEAALLYKISGKASHYHQVLSGGTGIPVAKFHRFVSDPAYHSAWGREVLVPKLQVAYPDKKEDIDALGLLLSTTQTAAAKIKKGSSEDLAKTWMETVVVIREAREKCGLSIEDVESRFKAPVLKGKLKRIEEGEPLGLSLRWSLASEACTVFSPYPQVAAEVKRLSEMKDDLRPR